LRYGYARTSTGDQTTALQLVALKKARAAHNFEDKGANRLNDETTSRGPLSAHLAGRRYPHRLEVRQARPEP
jgi:DNA invertase Pin-like site-specific DNA recombinase